MSSVPGGGAGADSVQFDYDANGNVIYVGLAVPGSATSQARWQIRKITYDGSNRVLYWQWANGNREFNNVWDNRTSLSYT